MVSERFIDVGYHAYRDSSGASLGVLAIIHDVTDKVATRMQESRMREAAEAANRAKDEFLAIVSHELRNPLNAMLGWARTLRGVNDPVRLAKGLAVIERNASAQATLIDDILDVSRIVSGKLVLDPHTVRVASVVQHAVESIRPAMLAKGIRFTVAIEDEQMQLVADADRLQQVVWNLLARTPPSSHPRAAMCASTHDASTRKSRIRVTDTGSGIRAEFLPFVFDRFRQADPSTTKRHAGLGLGLAIVRHLAHLHGGQVEATSEGEGRGATFEVRLPLHAVIHRSGPQNESGGPTTEGRAGRASRGGSPSLQGVHALVVDDQLDGRELLAAALVAAGAGVTEASSAAEATAALARANVTVLVSDIGMPGEDGYMLLRAVRTSPATRGIPALAVTAYARAEDRAKARAAGFDDYLAKPVDPDDLVRSVAALARREATQSLAKPTPSA